MKREKQSLEKRKWKLEIRAECGKKKDIDAHSVQHLANYRCT